MWLNGGWVFEIVPYACCESSIVRDGEVWPGMLIAEWSGVEWSGVEICLDKEYLEPRTSWDKEARLKSSK